MSSKMPNFQQYVITMTTKSFITHSRNLLITVYVQIEYKLNRAVQFKLKSNLEAPQVPTI